MNVLLTDEEIAALAASDNPTFQAIAARVASQRQELLDYEGHVSSARANYADDDLEIDDEPMLSVADSGVWVSAWVWVVNGTEEVL